MATTDELVATKAVSNVLIDILNQAALMSHPATAITALQYTVAQLLEAYGIPTEVFMGRVDATRKTING